MSKEEENNNYDPIIAAIAKEIDFGYHHNANDSLTIYPGPEDTTTTNFAADGSFVNFTSSVTYAIQKARENFQLPILVWILLLVLLVSIVVALIVVCCVCMKVKHRKTERKQHKTNNTRVSSHINGFSQDFHIPSSEMFQPKFVAKPQSYSTQKLYQWCQEREMQHYKSLWAVNTNGSSPTTVHISDRPENPNAYKTRSLPSKHKQRPFSSIEDLNEYYSKVNFSKKMKNRMTNDEAAIIAFCRTKSQNFSGGSDSTASRGDDAIVIYDERTAL